MNTSQKESIFVFSSLYICILNISLRKRRTHRVIYSPHLAMSLVYLICIFELQGPTQSFMYWNFRNIVKANLYVKEPSILHVWHWLFKKENMNKWCLTNCIFLFNCNSLENGKRELVSPNGIWKNLIQSHSTQK